MLRRADTHFEGKLKAKVLRTIRLAFPRGGGRPAGADEMSLFPGFP